MMLYLVELVVLALTPCVLFWRIVNGEAQPWDTLGFSFYLSSFHPYVLFVVNLYRGIVLFLFLSSLFSPYTYELYFIILSVFVIFLNYVDSFHSFIYYNYITVIQDIPPLLQEHATAKRPRTFYSIVVARFLFQLLLDLGASLLFYTLVYWDTKSLSGSGTYSSVNFLEFFGVSVLVHLSSVSLAYLSGSLFGRFVKLVIYFVFVYLFLFVVFLGVLYLAQYFQLSTSW